MKSKARQWLLAVWLLFSLGAGLGLGLAIGWAFWPRRPLHTNLSHVRRMYQEDYILMVSVAYAQDGDLQRAKDRLSYFGDERAAQLAADAVQKAVEQGAPLATRRHLARLAHALGASSPAIVAHIATPLPTEGPSPTPAPAEPLTAGPMDTPTPYRTGVLRPRTPTPATPSGAPGQGTPAASATGSTPTRPAGQTATPVFTRQVDYRLVELKQACEKGHLAGHILIQVQDAQGQGIPGARLKITWAQGEDSCTTGLHPDQSSGYADYRLSPGITYTVSLADATSEAAANLALFKPKKECAEADKPGSWEVIFRRR